MGLAEFTRYPRFGQNGTASSRSTISFLTRSKAYLDALEDRYRTARLGPFAMLSGRKTTLVVRDYLPFREDLSIDICKDQEKSGMQVVTQQLKI